MGVNIGFIGTGVIASALVTGFCSSDGLDHRIYLSPRNAERAAELAGRFRNVTVCSSNQEVLDKAEWIVIAVVPKYGEEVLRSLSFKKEHRVINLMSSRKLPEIAGWIGTTRTLVHMVPLPFASKRIGPIAIFPNDKDVAELFAPIGSIVGVGDVGQIEALQAITGLVSSYYTLLLEIVRWAEGEGLSREEANNYTTALFKALSEQVCDAEADELERLAGEMTPGGINEMALTAIKEHGGFEAWIRALDPALARLRKK